VVSLIYSGRRLVDDMARVGPVPQYKSQEDRGVDGVSPSPAALPFRLPILRKKSVGPTSYLRYHSGCPF
jgi:hypothetical protein